MKQGHLSFQERKEIERLLNQNMSIQIIAKSLERAPSTISREVKRHLVFRKTGAYGYPFNNCKLRKDCGAKKLCSKPDCTEARCSTCTLCNSVCKDYLPDSCPKPKQIACNGCDQKRRCTLEKRMYIAKTAQKEYKEILAEFRNNVCLTEVEFLNIKHIVQDRIQKGHSFYAICAANKGTFMVSRSSLYRYQEKQLFQVANLDLPRTVQRRPRKKPRPYKVDAGCRIGRNYQDYQRFLAENPDCPVVEMDSVIGRIGGKVLLTLVFPGSSLFLAFLREQNTADSVTQVFAQLRQTLGLEDYRRLFPILLTDNGSEFSNPSALEQDEDGQATSRVFYCDPGASYQKPAIENAHTMLRRILPKGSSFDGLTQEDIQLVVSHLNSYPRKNLGNLAPAEVFRSMYGDELLNKFGVQTIPAEGVVLKPLLLK